MNPLLPVIRTFNHLMVVYDINVSLIVSIGPEKHLWGEWSTKINYMCK